MSSPPPSSPKVPPAPAAGEPRAGVRPRPPNLYLESDPLARPDVKELLSELGVQPGEDPLYAALPEEAPDPDACAPDEAHVYMGPKTVPPAVRQHKTVDMLKVRVAPRVDPRRAVTQRVAVPAPVAVDQASPSLSAGPESRRAGRARWLLAAALVLAAVGVAALVWSRGPRHRAGEGEAAIVGSRGSAGAPAGNATARPGPRATAAPIIAPAMSASAPATSASAPVSLVGPAVSPGPARGKPRGTNDPHEDAAPGAAPSADPSPSDTSFHPPSTPLPGSDKPEF
ncbi:MAG: hypothetical protein ABI193_19245 [Minicystis sp.]